VHVERPARRKVWGGIYDCNVHGGTQLPDQDSTERQ
jgi:hypothetical protein